MDYQILNGVQVASDPAIAPTEIETILTEELVLYKSKCKLLGTLTLTLDNDEIVVASKSRESIKRLRRITGYLSNLDNFNAAKRQEANQRVVHG